MPDVLTAALVAPNARVYVGARAAPRSGRVHISRAPRTVHLETVKMERQFLSSSVILASATRMDNPKER